MAVRKNPRVPHVFPSLSLSSTSTLPACDVGQPVRVYGPTDASVLALVSRADTLATGMCFYD